MIVLEEPTGVSARSTNPITAADITSNRAISTALATLEFS